MDTKVIGKQARACFPMPAGFQVDTKRIGIQARTCIHVADLLKDAGDDAKICVQWLRVLTGKPTFLLQFHRTVFA